MMRKILVLTFLLYALIGSAQMQMTMRGTYSPVYTPSQLDSLFYWFKADEGVLDSLGGPIANDEGVGTWIDYSGRDYDVTQTTNTARPVWKATGGPGNMPCLQLDGSNDFLVETTASAWESDDITVITVMKFANATRNAFEQVVNKFEATTGNYRQWSMFARNAATSYIYWFAASTDGTGTNTKRWEKTGFGKHTTYKINTFIKSSTSGDWVQDGVNQTETLDNLSSIYNDTKKLGIGAQDVNGTPSSFLQGSISEIIVYSRALTADQRIGVEAYLKNKYGL